MGASDRDEGTDDTVRQVPTGPHGSPGPRGSLGSSGGPVEPAGPTARVAPAAPEDSGRARDREPGASGPWLPPGDGPRYALGPLLGQGGMGEVLLATDEHIGREVAVKRIRAERPTAEELSRFVREARVQGRLEHPAVVPVHDLGVDRDGRPFFVMKRLTGTEMTELLARLRGHPDEGARRRLLLRAFVDVCLAVEFAHSRGIIHRDLKPANIMLGDFGEVYVLDWGVARAVAEPAPAPQAEPAPGAAAGRDDRGDLHLDLHLDSGDTRVGTVLGTPAYMAPEQLAGEPAGPAADIYALGCILFEIAAGEALHPRARSLGQAFQPIDARPSARRPDSPPELDAICDLATRVDPAARHASARALGDAVQAYLDGDRDVAVRAQLARRHLAEARDALARGDAEEHRRAAMRAAGRALALDPTQAEAAGLVTHLMLTPPRVPPAEVERRIDEIDTETARTQGRLGALAMLGYLAFVPLLVWTGVREPAPIVAFAGLVLVSVSQVLALTRAERIPARGIYLNACINAALIAIVSRIVGPFIIAPTLVTTTLMAYATHARFGRIEIVAAILAAAVAVPWALEAAGVLPPTYRFAGGDLVLTSDVVRFTAAPVQLAFAVLLLALVAVVAVLLRSSATRQREATRRLELQAWHLRQIVPTAAR